MKKNTTFENLTNSLINNNPKRSFELNQELSKYNGNGEHEFGTYLRRGDSTYIVLETLDNIFTELGMPELMTAEELLSKYSTSERKRKLEEKCNGKVTQTMLFLQVTRILLGNSMSKNFNLDYRTGKKKKSSHFENSIKLHFSDLKGENKNKDREGLQSKIVNPNNTSKHKTLNNISKIMSGPKNNIELSNIIEEMRMAKENNQNFYVFLTGNNDTKEDTLHEDKGPGMTAISVIRTNINKGLSEMGVKYHAYQCGHLVPQSKKDNFHIPKELFGIHNGNNLGLETASENAWRSDIDAMEERFDVAHITKEIRKFAKGYNVDKNKFNRWLKYIKEAYKIYLSIDWEMENLDSQRDNLNKMGKAINSSREVIKLPPINWTPKN